MIIGHINYLNCLPLTYAFEKNRSHSFNIVRDVPSVLNGAITGGKLDVSPVSSIVYARNFDKLMILPGISIMADDHVQSIILVSKKPIEQLQSSKILLTSQSATSHCLLKIIMHKSYGAVPQYAIENISPENIFPQPDADASLFIGDYALYMKYHKQDDLYYYDIGHEWHKLTGMCMVYAVWVVRRDFAAVNPQETAHVQKFIQNGFKFGFLQQHEAIDTLARAKPFTHEQLDEYLHIIKWDLGAEQLRALSLFYRYAHEMKLIDKVPPLDIFKY